MDFDRLSLSAAAQLSRIIEVLGHPAAEEDLRDCVNICECAASMYRKALEGVFAANQRHR